MDQQQFGKRIKALRVGKKMTLKQVSEKTELSISFLSQVERSKSSVTLESLTKISEALGVSPSYFFSAEQNQPKSRLRRGDRQTASTVSPSPFVYEDLSSDFIEPLFTPMLVTLYPHEEKGKPFIHKGQEFLYILEGIFTILLGEEEHDLYPGDSIHMESSTPHNWFNRTDSPVRFLYVNSPSGPIKKH